MQLKIIQIALGWWGEKYSLKVSDWMRSKLCDTVRRMRKEAFRHVQGCFFFCFRGLGSSSISCRGSLDWRGIPFSSCFPGHWHAARQYVASQCELLCPAGWQRKATHAPTHKHNKLAAACKLEPNAAPASCLLAPFGQTTFSTCTVNLVKIHTSKTYRLMPGGCVNSCVLEVCLQKKKRRLRLDCLNNTPLI